MISFFDQGPNEHSGQGSSFLVGVVLILMIFVIAMVVTGVK